MEGLQLLAWFSVPLVTAGATWASVKVSLNGTRKKVDDMHRVIMHEEHGNVALHQRVKHVETGK